jgi:hypothetical protein
LEIIIKNRQIELQFGGFAFDTISYYHAAPDAKSTLENYTFTP